MTSYIGTIPSSVWSIKTDKQYTAPSPDVEPTNLYYFASGIEVTGALSNSFYSRLDVLGDTSEAKIWGASSPGGTADYVDAMPYKGNIEDSLLVGQGDWSNNDGVISRSLDYGDTWSEVASESTMYSFQGITGGIDTYRTLAGATNAVYESDNDGLTWSKLSTVQSVRHSNNTKVTCIAQVESGDIYIGCEGDLVFTPEPLVIMKSSDGGLTWIEDFASTWDGVVSNTMFSVNALKYHKATDTLWALFTDFASRGNNVLYYKTGNGPWTKWVISAVFPNLDFTGGTTFDISFNSSGIPTFISGNYENVYLGTIPCLWEYTASTPSGGSYHLHLGYDDIVAKNSIQYIYQIDDLTQDTTVIESQRNIYLCGSENLLKFTYDNKVNLSILGPTFTTEYVYLPDILTEWTPWSTPSLPTIFAKGMTRIPADKW